VSSTPETDFVNDTEKNLEEMQKLKKNTETIVLF
jgi:hypothetical protein